MNLPPLVEVASALRFQPLRGLSALHLARFWQTIDEDYPYCEEQDRRLTSPESPSPHAFFFRSKDERRVLQIQRDAFAYNLRRDTHQDRYPGYSAWSKEYREYLSTFESFLHEQSLGALQPSAVELVYVNQFPLDLSLGEAENFRRILPDFSWRTENPRFLPGPSILNWQTTCLLSEHAISLTIGVRAPVLPAAGPLKGLASIHMDLVARGFAQPGTTVADTLDWLDQAHSSIRRGYDDLVVEELRSERLNWEEAK